jgi:integrase
MKPRRLRDGRWLFRYFEDGTKKSPYRQVILPAETTKTEAFDEYRKKLAVASSRRGRGCVPRVTFDALAAVYLERAVPTLSKSWRVRVKQMLQTYILPALGSRRVDGLRPADFLTYRSARLVAGAANGTTNREVSAIFRVLSWAEENDLIDAMPVRPSKVGRLPEPIRETHFSPEEWQAVSVAFDDPTAWERHRAKSRELGPVLLRPGKTARRFGGGRRPESKASHAVRKSVRAAMPVFRTLLLTGSRLGEILALTWDAVDFERGRVSIFQPKTGRAKVLPLSGELRELFEGQTRGVGKALIFTRPSGGAWEARRLQRIFRLALALSGVKREGLSIHSLRHSAASWLTVSGVSERMVADTLGHASTAMTRRYSHLAPEHLQGALDMLGRLSKAAEEAHAS